MGTKASHAPTTENTPKRIRRATLLVFLLSFGACNSTGPDLALEPPENPDPAPPAAPDTAAGDSIPVPGPDSVLPPPDSTVPPPDSTGPIDPGPPPSHVGIPFGPYHAPLERFPEFSGSIFTATSSDTLLIVLGAARRASTRIYISFTGNEQYNRDSNGFSLEKWKQRVDRFRGADLTSYIADGTILGHFIMDEPSDPTNWNGHQVPHADIEAMAEYSKQIWPTMTTMIRAKTSYLKGHEYPHLDAVRVQYHSRFGSIDDYINENVQAVRALGLALVGGLNVINGGSPGSGIPGQWEGSYGMSAEEIRSWGRRYLSEPDVCAFFMWEYDSIYFSRPDIQAAVAELGQVAQSHPNKACRP